MDEIVDNARRFNFILPPGYTFVIPHRRGMDAAGSDQTAPETPIVARGLASLIAALE